jgi:arabinogalactan endo-1,4-beta-galactosidase
MVHDSGYMFYTQQGTAAPCLNVLQGVGINAVRLRVWLNPAGGWCNQADVVTKALAANALGQSVMLDFHYSDTWASGSTQTPPAAWQGYNIAQMEAAVASETTDVLNAIKLAGGTVSWVQVGNEINVGMLFPLGGVYGYGNNSWASLAGLINSGYAAVKSVFPGALVIVHLSSGENDSIFESFFDSLKAAGGKFDVIGMSAYPYWSGLPWATEVTDVIATMKDMTSRYGVPTMVCECGYLESDPSDCSGYLNALIAAAKQAGALGVFYWEPECYGSWPTAASGGTYTLGAFTAGGMPSAGMNAFADSGVAPYFTGQPTPQTIATGSSVVFNAPASAFPSPTFQWYLNGTLIAGATGPTLLIAGATPANAGNYTCVASNSAGSLTSSVATLGVISTSNPGRLVNISCRATVGTGGNILIAGFVVGGAGTTGSEPLLIRASGPALVPFGVTGTLADPQLQLFSGSAVLESNDGWGGGAAITTAASAVGAFGWASTTSHDAALVDNLAGGAYTAQIAGESGDTGVALAEVYDDTAAYTATSPRIVNISARVQVGTGGNILIVGFAVGGGTARTVLIRASGPALVPFGVAGTLPDPQLQLFSGSTVLESNDAWGGNAQIRTTAATVGAFPWSSDSSNDSAILVTLPPGPYTAQVSGASGDTGVALIEVYEVP